MSISMITRSNTRCFSGYISFVKTASNHKLFKDFKHAVSINLKKINTFSENKFYNVNKHHFISKLIWRK